MKSTIKSRLFWERFRPTLIPEANVPETVDNDEDTDLTNKFKILDNAIVLPRLLPLFQKPVELNMIFYGSSGLGKTTVARAIIQPYDHLIINASKDGRMDIFDEITDFCNVQSYNDQEIKIVLLEEYDGASTAFQKAFKAYVETNELRIRFIITTNVYIDIIDAGKSRFKALNFNPINAEEKRWLMIQYAKRLKLISESLSLDIDKPEIKRIVKEYFPDFRATLNELQYYSLNAGVKSNVLDSNLKLNLFNVVLNSINGDEVYEWVFDKIDSENKVEECLTYLGRDFLKHILKNRTDITIKKISELYDTYDRIIANRKDQIDPWLSLYTLIIKFQIILN